jgi:hypothetical protein
MGMGMGNYLHVNFRFGQVGRAEGSQPGQAQGLGETWGRVFSRRGRG